jgi:serine/threonine protein kinase
MKINMVKRRTHINSLKGGKYLGRGSFGCVITPEIECPNSLSTKKFNNNRKTYKNSLGKYGDSDKKVSKIILKPDETVKEEIKLSKKLNKLDPEQKYFITIIDYCKINRLPNNRKDILKVRYEGKKGEEDKKYTKLENKKLDKEYCPIDISKKPVNIVMHFAGFNLLNLSHFIVDYTNGKILKTPNNEREIAQKKLIMDLLKRNFKKYIKNLFVGMYKMHSARMVNRDIKIENITAYFNMQTQELELRYIDFGLAEDLTPEYITHYSNINKQGTDYFQPPEMFIIDNINYYNGYPDFYIMNKINRDIKDNVKSYCKENNLPYSDLNNIVLELFERIDSEFNDKTILNKYFGSDELNFINGYVQKIDVYSLGVSIYEFLFITELINLNDNPKLKDLLKNMMMFDPAKRYNILECLRHPYFTN